jgi:hypothetical protein
LPCVSVRPSACMSSAHSGRIFMKFYTGDFFFYENLLRKSRFSYSRTIFLWGGGVLWLKTEVTVAGDTVAIKSLISIGCLTKLCNCVTRRREQSRLPKHRVLRWFKNFRRWTGSPPPKRESVTVSEQNHCCAAIRKMTHCCVLKVFVVDSDRYRYNTTHCCVAVESVVTRTLYSVTLYAHYLSC